MLYLSYKKGESWKPFQLCFKTYVAYPGYASLMAEMKDYLSTALTKLYEQGTMGLVVVDDINKAPEEDVDLWITLAAIGKLEKKFQTVLITSPGEGIGMIYRVSDNVHAKRVTFGNLNRQQTDEFLIKSKGVMNPTLRCWIYHIIGSKPGDLDSHVLGSSMTKKDLLNLRDRELKDLAEEAHLEALNKVYEKLGKDGQSCFKDVVTVVANQTLNKHASMECLRTDDLAPLLPKYHFEENVLQVFLNAGNVLTRDSHRCFVFDSQFVKDFETEKLLGRPYGNVEQICEEELKRPKHLKVDQQENVEITP